MFKQCKYSNGQLCPFTEGVHCGLAFGTEKQTRIDNLKECPKTKKGRKKCKNL